MTQEIKYDAEGYRILTDEDYKRLGAFHDVLTEILNTGPYDSATDEDVFEYMASTGADSSELKSKKDRAAYIAYLAKMKKE